MNPNHTPIASKPSSPASPPSHEPATQEELLEQARQEAQERVAEVHLEEGTVKSEGGKQNSPHPDDRDPVR